MPSKNLATQISELWERKLAGREVGRLTESASPTPAEAWLAIGRAAVALAEAKACTIKAEIRERPIRERLLDAMAANYTLTNSHDAVPADDAMERLQALARRALGLASRDEHESIIWDDQDAPYWGLRGAREAVAKRLQKAARQGDRLVDDWAVAAALEDIENGSYLPAALMAAKLIEAGRRFGAACAKMATA